MGRRGGGREGERERGVEGQRETEGVIVVVVCVGDRYKWREGCQLCTHAHTDRNLTRQLCTPHSDYNTS